MSRNQSLKTTRLGFMAVALVGGLNLSSAAFAMDSLPQGYQLTTLVKVGEGKCGEGKCGDASFASTDTDGDALVSRKEFIAVAPTRASDFNTIDTDKDGFISELEAYSYLKTVYESNGKAVPKDLFTSLNQAN